MTAPPTAGKRRHRTGCLALVVAAVVIVAIIAATSSGRSGNPSPPAHFRATAADIRAVTVNAINGGDSPGISGQPAASCQRTGGGLTCAIAYAVKEPAGISNDLELFQPMRPIFKALFGVPNVQSVAIQVSGPTSSVGGKQSTSPLFSLTCDRAAAAQIDWSNVDEKGMKQLCAFVPMVGGL